jgi:hypothetical protein
VTRFRIGEEMTEDSARQSGKRIGKDDGENSGAEQGISLTVEADYAEMHSV